MFVGHLSVAVLALQTRRILQLPSFVPPHLACHLKTFKSVLHSFLHELEQN